MKKRLFPVVLTLATTVGLAACGGTDTGTGGNGKEAENNEGNASSEDPQFLNLLTGGTSGTYYPLGGEMATFISDGTGVETTAQSSNASAENVAQLSSGDAEIAFVQTDVMSNAVEGVNSFEGEPVDNVLALGSLYPETIQIVTTADSGIESVEDLAGKSVSVGAPGSGTYVNAEQILEIHGMSMDDINQQPLSFDESTSGIQDGNIDAAFITAGTPTGAVEGLSATNEVAIVPIAEDKVNELIETYPYYASDVIEAGTYGMENEVQTVAVLAMIAVSDTLSEDLVYNMTKSIYENAENMAHEKAQFIKLENALDGIGTDVHPGAQRYYDEQGVSAK
ncbi:C4-dicarboxylate ABC transporter substrate-binding protein [Shouchella clausii]|uniref:TAXI family TRAP transporter solute-binding subunit n=1 Tax=Shouchella clausii TaxID=79880 RepID=UPI000BA5914E|nr:TAXI family TRAP transporter solute-binding subunit [Shouchella clausii]PAD07843.1 C4-dicarboxylate ABC transporter substrate-binding protein [Shouchella clausii]PAE79551.1 C4-dicarboxylate ABC transporter substrate-binding protein [Shouchella clausii]PAF04090.1 C4-dicarboxylate ABC transporter substrate-binding protein [Shouchella clausii]